MKRFIAFIVAVLLLPVTFLSGCHQNTVSDGKISVVCTIFPAYDWVRQILGDTSDDVTLTLLLDHTIDLHSYQPSIADIATISSCDLFIYVGGESDAWVENILSSATNKDMTVINLLVTLGDSAKAEAIIEGMEHEHEHEHDTPDPDDVNGHSHENEGALDEHVWLSLQNASVFCTAIATALSDLYDENAEMYQNNLVAYKEKLSNLDAAYRAAVNAASTETLLFGDRFPFRYLTDDYGLTYYAAFPGCSAETEASFETIIFLAGKVDELRLRSIIVTESADQSIAQTIKNNTANKDQQILVLDSMQSVSGADIQAGIRYLDIMESNLYVLKDALESPPTNTPTDTRLTETQGLAAAKTAVDVDLTALSSIMVYAEVYNMMIYPEDYLGKTIKMSGPYYSLYYDLTDQNYHYVIIEDATACCQSGLEFVWEGEHQYPDDYPAAETVIEVAGVFGSYEELGETYYYLAVDAITY